MTVQIEYLGFEQDDFASPNNGPTGAEVTHTFTIASGDLLVAFVNRNNTTTSITPPTGWIELKTKAGAETSLYWIGYRIAGSSEPSSWTWDIGENTSWDISVRHYRTNGSNIQFSDILEDAGTAGQTATINTQAVPVNSLSLIHIQTDTSGAYCQSVTGFDSVLPAAVTSRTQQTGHFINTDYEKSPATPTVTFDTGSTIFVSNHFYVTWTFQKSVLGPAFIHRPWAKQPPAGTPIDWSNPLARGLVFAAPTADGRDAVTGNLPNTVRANNIIAPANMGRFGSAMASQAAPGTTTNVGRLYPDTYAHSKCFGQPGFTMWSLQISKTGDTWEMPFCIDLRAGDNDRIGYQGSSSNVNIYYRIGYSDDTDLSVTTPTQEWPANALSTLCMRFDRTKATERFEMFVDNVRVDSDNASDKAVGWTSEADSNTIIINDSDQPATNDNFDGPVALALMWNRALTDAELEQLEQNPWQIFKPRNIYIGTPPKRKVVVY